MHLGRAAPSLELSQRLKEHGVVVRPGREFGPAGEFHLRISIAASHCLPVLPLAR
jgi:aspartate/methionine/tyrosine aminotransferase